VITAAAAAAAALLVELAFLRGRDVVVELRFRFFDELAAAVVAVVALTGVVCDDFGELDAPPIGSTSTEMVGESIPPNINN
jgi:hypothetical protein